MKNTALIIVDMQTGLLNRPVVNQKVLIENINKLLKFFHDSNGIVILLRHTNNSFSKIDSDDWQVSSEIHTTDTDILFNKSHSSVFKEKAFIKLLDKKQIDSLVVAGLVSNGCVQATCLDAKKHGLDVILASDAHSTWHKDALKVISDWNTKLAEQEIQVLTTQEILEMF